ncbi:Phosphotransferase enzyme [Cadophora gregata]|uniref:Phosphotransferase enzyme n=1 Tax=Cadophora gregata TaxID=51156 RepID=UPI0026DB6154|nr:Phosphotransferase enzyme [Cadophora gregata]KAK0105681.1 Phosphotransferase enzyme [Cadophora gregata]
MMHRFLWSKLSRRLSMSTSASASVKSKALQNEHFFRYTSGRWLWDEEERLQERYRKFNVDELKRIGAESIGAKSCVSITKLDEGGYNKVFKLVMDNGSVAIARIPCPNAGPPSMTTASEVATMDFARTILNLPVPKVHAWSAVSDNPVEAEYILMEEACGTSLGDIWEDMELHSKVKIVEDIISIEQKLLSVSFSRYGNIYFAKDSFPGCEKAEVSGDISEDLKQEVEERFTIGPVVEHAFWRRDQTSMPVDRGPWKSADDYLKALANNQVTWLSQYAPRKTPNIFQKSVAQESPDAHIALYKKYLAICPYILPKDERMARSTLWHWDLHASNLFVKDERVTCIIDWQSTWAGPLFAQYRYPKLVHYAGEVMLRLPDDYETMEGNEKVEVSSQVQKSIVQYLYESKTEDSNPLLTDIVNVPQRTVRKQTIAFAEDSWEGGILSFRQCLIRLERYWDEMKHDAACPIHFSEEDLRNHVRDAEGYNEQADFWDSLEGFVARDGWTSNERYEEALDLFAGIRERGLEQLTGEERSDFEKNSRWAQRSADRSDGS